MNKHLPVVATAVLVSCFAANGPVRAQGADIKTIVSVNGPPVVVNQSSPLNMVGIFQIGGNTSATVTQNGSNNATGVLQFGGTTSSSVGQAGVNNVAFVGQAGQSTSSFLSQFGAFNSATIVQNSH